MDAIQNPNFFAHVVMVGILFVSVWAFGAFPVRAAVMMILVGGWLALPQTRYSIHLIPFHNKTSAISLALLLGVVVRRPKGFMDFKISWMDLPVTCWCIAPFITSVVNGLGAYDGAQAMEFVTIDFGIPYVLGRSFFGTFESLKELAIAMVVGALILAPLVVFELVMSPQLHTWVYGWYPHDFIQTMRDGGYRPSVFMSHGLELAIWNAAAAFTGWQMYLRGTIKGSFPLLRTLLLPSLIGLSLVLMVSHSTGALFLFLLALAVAELSIRMKTILPLLLVALLPATYIGLRASGAWDGQSLVDAALSITGSAERTSSLAFRIRNESLLAAKAREQIVFGWGRFQRSAVFDKNGRAISVPDGQWIGVMGEEGLFGVAAINAIYLVPALCFFLKLPMKRLGGSLEAPAVAFSIFFCITMIDNLFNAMPNPVLILASGGLVSLISSPAAMNGFRENRPEPSAMRSSTHVRVI